MRLEFLLRNLCAAIHSPTIAESTTLSREQSLQPEQASPTIGRVPRKNPAPVPIELKTLPGRLKYARERAELTVTGLAKRAELDKSQVSRIETGQAADGIEAATIIRLARALGTPVGWLAADEGEPGPVPVFREGRDRRRKPKDE
jgi:ribosome-binding protein aMBF1 (putative translation factor)